MSEQDLRRRVQAPGDAVLDLLGRVRLVEELGEEELQDIPGSRAASSGGSPSPSPRRPSAACRSRTRTRHGCGGVRNGNDGAIATTPRRGRGGRRRAPARSARRTTVPTATARRHAGGVEHGDGVRHDLGVGVGRLGRRADPRVRCRDRRTSRPGNGAPGSGSAPSRCREWTIDHVGISRIAGRRRRTPPTRPARRHARRSPLWSGARAGVSVSVRPMAPILAMPRPGPTRLTAWPRTRG